MASFLFSLLRFTIFLLIVHSKPCFPSKPSLLLPIKTQTIPRLSSATSTTSKLPFRHNVSLTVSLQVGSPPQNITMVLDTGSELSWLHCNKSQNFNSFFNPFASSSYSTIPCTSSVCTNRTRDLPIPASCDTDKLCHVIISYADLTSSEGNLATETMSMGSLKQPRFIFGCMYSGFSSSSEEDSRTTGLMGMNLGSLSFVTQMRYPKFSYCISGFESTGVLIFGDERLPWLKPLNYTPLVKISDPLPNFDRVAYSIQLEGIRVGSKMLNLPKSDFTLDHTGAGQTMVDSGTQFSFLLGPVYTALRNEFLQQTKGILRVLNDPNFVFQGTMDLCYLVESTRRNLPELPVVSLLFTGAEVSVSGPRLLYRVPGLVKNGKDSVYCFTFGNSDLLGIESFVIGHHHQQNIWMEFDLAKSRVGFTEFRCDIASKNLGIGLI
ncbi:aspartic proteinase PCS1 [Mangifera indica]|uniref:aspartic proteinase PCS1 n=1 Tax=Mangifera indica TaxID=29780 RepID=UPI001CF97E68|nr:aspartic proteinase PCS1 [Mangifera indica]